MTFIQKYLSISQAPLLLNTCGNSKMFPLYAQKKADELFGDGKFRPGYKRHSYEGCKHGFAVRGDINDPDSRAGKEGAFRSTVEWFIAYL
jgi:hypothetical protein